MVVVERLKSNFILFKNGAGSIFKLSFPSMMLWLWRVKGRAEFQPLVMTNSNYTLHMADHCSQLYKQ